MAEHGFTPGPWSYRSQPHDDWGVVRAGRFWICQAKDPRAFDDETLAAHRAAKTDPWEANARLIAASPTLLEALEQVARPYGMLDIAVNNARGEMVDEMLTVAKQIRAAITLATGKDA